jgi:transcriptional regulator with GAF, ATPase, and Fis domain
MAVVTVDELRPRTPAVGGPIARWHGIVGASRLLADVIRRIELVAAARNSTVLITGETGTGKELVARAIHGASVRRGRPFVTVNCAAIPSSLLESELFGHVRGAFTGAASNRKGRFLLADGGTIFLDEVPTMGADLQAKLLRVLQEREVEPLGAERTHAIDVRVVAATNRDLRPLVASGQFKDDLFYRLNVFPIVLPPLRERLDDIPALADFFVSKHAARNGKRIGALARGVLDLLQTHTWPGNVRELENTIERAVVVTMGDTIPLDAVAIDATEPPAGTALPSFKLRDNITWIERETVRRALQFSPTKQQAATLLGISQRALSYYLKKYRFADGDRSYRCESIR